MASTVKKQTVKNEEKGQTQNFAILSPKGEKFTFTKRNGMHY